MTKVYLWLGSEAVSEMAPVSHLAEEGFTGKLTGMGKAEV